MKSSSVILNCQLVAAAILCSLFLAGCASKGDPAKPRGDTFNIEVIPDASVQGESIEVDLIGVNNQLEVDRLNNVSVSDYFQPANPERKYAKGYSTNFVLGFTATGGAETNRVGLKDEIWSTKWKNARYLVVFANLTGDFVKGTADPRRKVIPLDRRRYEVKKKTLQIEVHETGVKVLNPDK